jgi:hypothetical protein
MGNAGSGVIALVFGIFTVGFTAGDAAADADWFVVAGASHGGDAQLVPEAAPAAPCATCFAAGEAMETDGAAGARLATIGAGLAGREGALRGGGELMTILGMGDSTSGYTAVVTYGGLDSGRLFVQGGIGLGSYWGGDHGSMVDALAGDVRAELGVRLHQQWQVLGRGDLLVNNTSVAPVVTLGLQWTPHAR